MAMSKPPNEITICHLEVVVMPNGEVICAGKSIGWVDGKAGIGEYLTPLPPSDVVRVGIVGLKPERKRRR